MLNFRIVSAIIHTTTVHLVECWCAISMCDLCPGSSRKYSFTTFETYLTFHKTVWIEVTGNYVLSPCAFYVDIYIYIYFNYINEPIINFTTR